MVGVLGKPKKGRGNVIWVFDGSKMSSGVVVGIFGGPKRAAELSFRSSVS